MATFSMDVGIAVEIKDLPDTESTERWLQLISKTMEHRLLNILLPIEGRLLSVTQAEVFDTRRND